MANGPGAFIIEAKVFHARLSSRSASPINATDIPDPQRSSRADSLPESDTVRGETAPLPSRPVHAFTYPVLTFMVDLTSLCHGRMAPSWLVRYNRWGIFSFWDKDYLTVEEGTVLSKLEKLLSLPIASLADMAPGLDEIKHYSQVLLVSVPRTFGYVFNPVNFYFCYQTDSSPLTAVVAEVNNTFSERHLYLLTSLEQVESATDSAIESGGPSNSTPRRYRARHTKEFHVSPFYDRRGHYEFEFADPRLPLAEFDVLIRYVRPSGDSSHTAPIYDGDLIAHISGKLTPYSDLRGLAALLRYPFSAFLTFPRITWQAGILYFKKKIPWHVKPPMKNPRYNQMEQTTSSLCPISQSNSPQNVMSQSGLTLSTDTPSALERLCMLGGKRFLSKFTVGHLTLDFPDGTQWAFGDRTSGLQGRMAIHSYQFFTRSLFGGDVGFGESYTLGEWSSPDLAAVLTVFVENEERANDRNLLSAGLRRIGNRCLHLLRRNSITGSRRNIGAHYDLSNEMFKNFLDPSMTYSCALFSEPTMTLEEAQREKIHALIRKAKIDSSHHVLEIGCGWGSFAIEAVKQTGCRVTGITLSVDQQREAQARVKAAGLEDRISIELIDYRQHYGSYDRIVSIEMFEAVGKQYWGTFFQKCDELLKPGGILVMQIISIADPLFEAYERSCDWIQKYVFPGGIVPSLSTLLSAVTGHSRFVVDDLENIGIHYVRTLREWREKFEASWDTIESLGFPPHFRRLWCYYLAYCEAGFATRRLGDLHIVFTRPFQKELAT